MLTREPILCEFLETNTHYWQIPSIDHLQSDSLPAHLLAPRFLDFVDFEIDSRSLRELRERRIHRGEHTAGRMVR
jgi:hypothetical protein